MTTPLQPDVSNDLFEQDLVQKKPWYRQWWVLSGVGIFLVSLVVLALYSQQTVLLIDQFNPEQLLHDQIAATLLPEASESSVDEVVPLAAFDELVTTYSPRRGNEDAPIVVVEFADFQCPFCRQAAPVIQQFLEKYPDDVFFVYRHFPIDAIHPLASTLAEASFCAQDQQAFWEFHDAVFAAQASLTDRTIATIAQNLGLDMTVFADCLEADTHSQQVADDFEQGYDLGVVGTPTFFINGRRFSGVVPLDVWDEIVRLILELDN